MANGFVAPAAANWGRPPRGKPTLAADTGRVGVLAIGEGLLLVGTPVGSSDPLAAAS